VPLGLGREEGKEREKEGERKEEAGQQRAVYNY
jgi:hypothetical protein